MAVQRASDRVELEGACGGAARRVHVHRAAAQRVHVQGQLLGGHTWSLELASLA